MAPYFEVLPPHVDHFQIAYHFEGDYESESRVNPSIVEKLEAEIAFWREKWKSTGEALPALECVPISEDTFILADTRGLPGCLEFEFIDLARASMALVGRTPEPDAEAVQWALERKVCVKLDGKFVPLATAPTPVLNSFESTFHAARWEGPKFPIIGDLLTTTNR